MGDCIEEDEEPESDRCGSSDIYYDIWRQCQEDIRVQNAEAQESGTQGNVIGDDTAGKIGDETRR